MRKFGEIDCLFNFKLLLKITYWYLCISLFIRQVKLIALFMSNAYTFPGQIVYKANTNQSIDRIQKQIHTSTFSLNSREIEYTAC